MANISNLPHLPAGRPHWGRRAILTEDDIKSCRLLIPISRRQPVNFGFCLGKKVPEDVLVLHKIKSPKSLARVAKERGTSPKILFGTLTTEGKILTLHCELTPLAGLARRVRLLLKQAKLRFAIRVIDPDGQLAEEDLPEEEDEAGEDDSDDTPPPEEAEEDKDTGEDRRLEGLFAGLRAEIVAFGKENRARLSKSTASELSAVLKTADTARDQGRLAEAISLLQTLQQHLDDALQETEESEDEEVETAAKEDVSTARAAVTALGREKLAVIAAPERKRLSAALQRADLLAKEGRHEDAADILIPLQDDLQYAGQPTDLLPLWRETRAALDDQIAILRHAMRSFDDPELDEVAEVGFVDLTGRRSIAMVAALLDYRAGGGAPARAALLKAIAAYEELLQSGSILEDYDNNPYGASVKLRDTLSKGLRALRDRIG
ncbi:hypothetical protein [Caenispirillum bisanense]|uniref:hypothetical protein n=1 Tax=Caenispirillum bisanense TaxID=414052 RepID=UPI0031DD627B